MMEPRAQSTPSLPPELWSEIFGFLSQPELLVASSVSKAFHALARDPLLWTSLNLTLDPHKKETHLKLVSRCSSLSRLQLTSGANLDGRPIDAAAIQAPRWSFPWPTDGVRSESSPESDVRMHSDCLVDVIQCLVDFCPQLRLLRTEDLPDLSLEDITRLKLSTEDLNLSEEDITRLKLSTEDLLNLSETKLKPSIGGCDIKQIFNFDLKREQRVAGFQVRYTSVDETDYYRKGNPYKILRSPGKSKVDLRFMITSLGMMKASVLTLNHCRTTADGVVNLVVNGATTRQILAPRYDFGFEAFTVEKQKLVDGQNVISLVLDATSPGVYWLSDAKVQTDF